MYKKITNISLLYDIYNTYEGIYRFANDILWLNCEGKDYPMLFVNVLIYRTFRKLIRKKTAYHLYDDMQFFSFVTLFVSL